MYISVLSMNVLEFRVIIIMLMIVKFMSALLQILLDQQYHSYKRRIPSVMNWMTQTRHKVNDQKTGLIITDTVLQTLSQWFPSDILGQQYTPSEQVRT